MQRVVILFVFTALLQASCKEASADETYWCIPDAKIIFFGSGAQLTHKETIIENGKETTFWPGCFYHNLASKTSERQFCSGSRQNDDYAGRRRSLQSGSAIALQY
jgi:hypothetical protein